MDPVTTIDSLLQHVSAVLDRQSEQVLQEQLGIGMSQLKILRSLLSNPATKQRSIAASLGQTEASVSRQIKLLHTKGLLLTHVDPKNRRQHQTVLTSKGLRLADAALAVIARYHAPTFAGLSEKQRQALVEGLLALHNQICIDEATHDSK